MANEFPFDWDKPRIPATVADVDTVAWLEQQRAELIATRALGMTSQRAKRGDDEKEWKYRTDAELAAAIADIDRRLGAVRPLNIKVRSSKGWL